MVEFDEDAAHDALYSDEDDWSDLFDGDECPNCGRSETRRIDIIASDPNVWACECFICGEHFEVISR